MKIRIGFVSNSSAASFCIYGWTSKELENTRFKDEEFKWYPYECKKFVAEIHKIDPTLKITSSHTPEDYFVIGVGEAGTEIDHNMEYDQDWHDYRCPEPSISKGKRLDEVAKKLDLPQPKLYADTWFDG